MLKLYPFQDQQRRQIQRERIPIPVPVPVTLTLRTRLSWATELKIAKASFFSGNV
jgi:hypothetical protein